MSDHIDRAAEVINRHILPVAEGDPRIGDGKVIAQALADAGLLVGPEHDAQVAARALRDAAEELQQQGAEPWNRNTLAIHTLRFRADRIEREGGAS